jgi:hypothetical protein
MGRTIHLDYLGNPIIPVARMILKENFYCFSFILPYKIFERILLDRESFIFDFEELVRTAFINNEHFEGSIVKSFEFYSYRP